MNSILLDQVRGPQREVPEREGQHLWRSSNYAGVHHSNVLSLACVSQACAREGYFSHWLATWRLGCQVCIHSCWGWKISAQPREFHRSLSSPLLCFAKACNSCCRGRHGALDPTWSIWNSLLDHVFARFRKYPFQTCWNFTKVHNHWWAPLLSFWKATIQPITTSTRLKN